MVDASLYQLELQYLYEYADLLGKALRKTEGDFFRQEALSGILLPKGPSPEDLASTSLIRCEKIKRHLNSLIHYTERLQSNTTGTLPGTEADSSNGASAGSSPSPIGMASSMAQQRPFYRSPVLDIDRLTSPGVADDEFFLQHASQQPRRQTGQQPLDSPYTGERKPGSFVDSILSPSRAKTKSRSQRDVSGPSLLLVEDVLVSQKIQQMALAKGGFGARQ